MSNETKTTRAKLMRKLHAVMRDKYDIKNPHPDLHRMAVSEYEVESMSHCSEKELQLLLNKICSENIDWNGMKDAGVSRIPEMSDKQQSLVKKLQKELGWSDSYIIEIAIRRYGYLHYKYLTGREAWAYCNYLIKRRREKLAKEKKDGSKVPA